MCHKKMLCFFSTRFEHWFSNCWANEIRKSICCHLSRRLYWGTSKWDLYTDHHQAHVRTHSFLFPDCVIKSDCKIQTHPFPFVCQWWKWTFIGRIVSWQFYAEVIRQCLQCTHTPIFNGLIKSCTRQTKKVVYIDTSALTFTGIHFNSHHCQ